VPKTRQRRISFLILLLAILVMSCGHSGMNEFMTGDVVAEDLTGTSRLELRLDLPQLQARGGDLRRLRLSAFNAQGNLVYGPTEKKLESRLRLNEVPHFARSLLIEYLSGSEAIVVGEAEVMLQLSEGAFASVVDPPFKAVPPGKLRIFPRAVPLAPGEQVGLRALEETRDGTIDQSSKVIWSSSDPSKLRVSNAAGRRGQVTPVGDFRAGDVTITARMGAAQVVALHQHGRRGQISGIHYQGRLRTDMFGEVETGGTLTCLDLDGDGTDEVAVASGGEVRGLDLGGRERFRLQPWIVAAGTVLDVAAADVNQDGQPDLLVAGVAAEGHALVRGYDGSTLSQAQPRVLFTINDLSPNYSGGANLATAVGLSGGPLVAVGAGPGRSPEVSVYGLYKGPYETLTPRLTERRLAFNAAVRGGVRVALGDLDFDGMLDLITAPGPGSPALVLASTIGGEEIWRSQLADGPTSEGITLAAGQLYGGPEDDVVARVAFQKSDDINQAVILDGASGARVFSFDPLGQGPVALATGNVGLADQREASGLVRLTSTKLARLEVWPEAATLSSQIPTVQLGVRTRYADGQVLDASDLVAWSLAPNSGESTSLSKTGLVTALQAGTATARAGYRGLVAESVLHVAEPPLPRTLSIVPVDSSGREGTDVRFQALGSLPTGMVIDLSDRVVWSSENEGVVRFDPLRRGWGQVRGQGRAVVACHDKLSGVSAKMVFHGVAQSPPNGLAINPEKVELNSLTQTRTLTVEARYPEGLEIPIHEGISWSSSNPDIKVNGSGKVSVAPQVRESCQATVTATVSSLGKSASAQVELKLPPLELQALYVSPSRPVLEPDQALPLMVEGRYGEGSSSFIQAVTSGLTFSSSNPEVLKVSSSGVLRAGSLAGTARISVTHESGVRTEETAEVKLPLPMLRAITVTLAPPSAAVGEGSKARATGFYDSGPSKDLTNSVVWSSSAAGVAVVSSNGAIESLAEGETAINAIDLASGKNGEAIFKVKPPRLLSLTLLPSHALTTLGDSLQLSAEGTYSNGEVRPVNPTWVSANPAIFSFTSAATGLGVGLAPGAASVIATLDQVSASLPVTVEP
jgi:hypothetical protein